MLKLSTAEFAAFGLLWLLLAPMAVGKSGLFASASPVPIRAPSVRPCAQTNARTPQFHLSFMLPAYNPTENGQQVLCVRDRRSNMNSVTDQGLYDAFEDCLRRLRAGQSLEACLRCNPEWAEELRPELEAAQVLSGIGTAAHAIEVQLRSCVRFLRAAAIAARRRPLETCRN